MSGHKCIEPWLRSRTPAAARSLALLTLRTASARRSSSARWAALVFTLVLGGYQVAHAAVRVKDNNTDYLSTDTSWVGGKPPGTADIGQWDKTVTSANTVTPGKLNLNWSGLRIMDPGGLVTIVVGAHDTLTLGTAGVDMTAASADLILNLKLVLSGANTWDVASGRTFSGTNTVSNAGYLLTVQGAGTTLISGPVSGSGGLTKNGAGLLALGGASANTFSGLTTVNGGELDLNKAAGVDAIASGLIVNNGAFVKLLADEQINDAVGITNASGGTLHLNGHQETIGVLLNNGHVWLGSNGALRAAGWITNAAGGWLAGSGVISNTLANLRGASLMATNGTLTITGAGGLVQGGTVTVADGSALHVATSWTNAAGGVLDLNGGAIRGADLVNDGELDASGNAVVSPAFVNSGTTMVAGAEMTFGGIVTNSGLIRVTASRMTFHTNLVISGRYQSSAGATNVFLGNTMVLTNGTLEGGPAVAAVRNLFNFQQDLFIQATNSARFDLSQSTILFSGGIPHTNTVTGSDAGRIGSRGVSSGFITNYAYGALKLGSTADVLYVLSGNGAANNALYVEWLDLSSLTNLFASVSDMVASMIHAPSSISIYYDGSSNNPLNAYLMDATYQLTDALGRPGGLLMPAVPEPPVAVLVGIAIVWLVRRAR